MKDTVAIIGSHPRTRGEFDFSRTDADVWVFNEAISNKTYPRADAVFQMHDEAIWRNPANRNDPNHAGWLKSQTEIPVYMQDKYEDVPASVKFPLEEIANNFATRYFTSSVAYAIALACFKGYKKIEIYGVEMETNTEYQYQRDGVTLWIGIARGAGIEVDPHMSIFDQPLYGYEGEVVIDYTTFDERINDLIPQVEEGTKQYSALYLNMQAALKEFENGGSMEVEDKLYKSVEALVKAGEALGMIDGARQENLRYKGKADVMRAETGGKFLFSRQEFESAAKNLTDKMNSASLAFNSHGTTLGHIHALISKSAKGSPKRQKAVEAYINVLNEYLKASNQAAIYKGAAQENYLYMAWLDKHIRAAGGAKSEAVLLESMAQNG